MDDGLDIAIVGLACRFPGARNAEEFWRNLAAGVESITQLSDDDILQSGAPRSHLTSPNYVKAAPVLDEPGAFDATFFGYAPGEARTMDPQHRILLELAHEAIEDAGCDPARLPARVGVFAGAAMNTYFMHAGLNRNFAEDYIPTLIFNDKDFLSTRISYKLDLKGPSLTVQTACSTSLVAVHLARQSLLSEESDIALAGAISVRVPHRAGYFSDPGGVSSPDGHVRAFDAGANGTVFGSGGGVVVLKRLRDALADGDTIRAIIKGSAINNDGAEKAGYTAPSVNSQADAVVEALANADVDADSISYIEAHGSGTPVGDPIEIRALTRAFRASTQRTGFCAIGSVKTNVGHLDAAAGMAGLIKTILALQHRQIPPSLNYSRPNPEIDFPASPFFVSTQLTSWPAANGPRRAGIMSTGMGGTNAHIVLGEAPQIAPAPEAHRPNLLVLSARTESALAASADRLREFLEANPSIHLDDAVFTLQMGRRAMQHRRFVVAADRAGAVAALAAKPARLSISRVDDGAKRPLVLLLSGVGDHYVGMGRELYAAFPAFRAEVDRCAEILHPHLGLDIREILWPKNLDWQKASTARGIDLKKMLAGNTQPPEDEDALRLNQVEHLQPALFTIEYALARLWIDLGIVSQAIVGHSMGEYVAACLSGVFSLEDALHLIVRRTQLVASLPPARMLAVTLPESDLRPLLTGNLSIALINGPNLCVVAGPPPAVQEFERTLTARSVTCRSVQNSHAFHSRLLDPVVSEFEREVRKVRLSAPQIPFISNVTGQWISTTDAVDPSYWARHLNHTARFDDALRTLWQKTNAILLEAGPGGTLGVLAMQHPDRQKAGTPVSIASLRHHYEDQPDLALLLNAAGRLWVSGAEIRWAKLHRDQRRRKISLPTYPFERQNFWIGPETLQATSEPSSKDAEPALPGIDQWFYSPSWERTVFPEDPQHPTGTEGILWLIISDRSEHAAVFRKGVNPTGATVRSVLLGERFGRRTDGSFEINPANRDDYLKLLREIKGEPCKALRIVHLGCVAADRDKANHGDQSCDQNLGFFSLLFIAQAIGELNISIPVTIGFISAASHEVTGDENLTLEMATALGLCGVIPKEFSNVTCFNVDLPGTRALDDSPAEFAARILSEFAKPSPGDVIAYRGRHRWKRAFERVNLPAPTPSKTQTDRPVLKRLRNRGVYLITGGTGGLGLAVARYLAEACQARLVLTRRKPFPEKSEWQRLLTAGNAPEPVLTLIKELLEIESLGAEVEVIVADVSDREQMREALCETLRKFHSLNGVLHAAGVVRAGLIQTLSSGTADASLSPKVQGTLVLHEVLQAVDLDFLVLFSSLASITGPFAHADYSAANSFLDAFASYSNYRTKYHTVAINWPVWKEIGAVAKLETFMGVEAWKDEALKKAILTKDGLDAFGRILNSDLSQVIVSPENLEQVLVRSRGVPDPSMNLSGSRIPIAAASSERTQINAADQPTDETETVVARIWSSIFGIEQIGIHEKFTDLGGHSLMALQILMRIRTQYRVDISIREFFEATTIAQLSALVQDKVLQDIESMTDDEVRKLIANETQAHD